MKAPCTGRRSLLSRLISNSQVFAMQAAEGREASLHWCPSTIFFAHSTARQRAALELQLPYTFLCGLTLKLKVTFTIKAAKGLDVAISKVLITQVNKLGMLPQQAHAGCFTRNLTNRQKEAE